MSTESMEIGNTGEHSYKNGVSDAVMHSLEVKMRWGLYGLAEDPVDFYHEAFARFPDTENTVNLDIGCSDGRLAKQAARSLGMRAVILGLDPEQSILVSPDNVEAEQGVRFGFIQGKAEEIPLGDETVDNVSAIFSLYTTDLHSALQEIHRVLKPGGILAASTNSWDNKPLHRLLEAHAAFHTGASEPPSIAAERFYSEHAPAILDHYFEPVEEPISESTKIIIGEEDISLLVNSLSTTYGYLSDADKENISPYAWLEAVRAAVNDVVRYQIGRRKLVNAIWKASGMVHATDWSYRDLYIYRKAM